MGYQFELINRDNFNKYQKFTFPRYRYAFSDADIEEKYFGIGVIEERTPLGLILGKTDSEYPNSMIIGSVFVIADYRRKGLAALLFKQFEAEVANQGFQSIKIIYIDNRESIRYLERILKQLGWRSSEVSDLIYKCSCIDNLNHEWINKQQLKEAFSSCNYTELTQTEKTYLKEGRQVWYYQGLSPFLEEERISPETTLFLKYQGEIIGWCGTFKASAETLAYRSVFVKQEFRGMGVIIPLLAKAIRIHCQMLDRFPYAAFQVSLQNRAMQRIITKGICKEFVSVTKQLVSFKKISEEE